MESSRTANHINAQIEAVDDFSKGLELLMKQSKAVTTTTLSTNAQSFDSGSSQNNHPNNSNSTKQTGNNTSTATKSNDTNVVTSSVVANAVPTSNDIPCITTTNKNIQSASTSSILHTKRFASTKSLGDAKQTQLFAITLASVLNNAMQQLGSNPSEEEIINQGKTLVLPSRDQSWQRAEIFVHSGNGGLVVPKTTDSDGCVAGKVSLGYASCGARGTHTTSILQFSDRHGMTSLHKPGDANILNQTYISVYDMNDNLLKICISVKGDLRSTLRGMQKHWEGNLGNDSVYPTIEDIKAAGSVGLPIGNKGSKKSPERLLRLKLTTEDDRYDHTASEREDMLAAATKAHADSAKLRKAASNSTDSLFEILNRNKETIAKSKTLMAATKFHGGLKGVRSEYGKATYLCDSQPGDCTPRPQHKPPGKGKKVSLKETLIKDEMDWQVENKLEVLGFRDDGGKGGEDKVRYIRIISRKQFEDLKVEELIRTDFGNGKKAGKKRKAAETEDDDRKPAAKRRSKRNKK